jgi:hypothetical protein
LPAINLIPVTQSLTARAIQIMILFNHQLRENLQQRRKENRKYRAFKKSSIKGFLIFKTRQLRFHKRGDIVLPPPQIESHLTIVITLVLQN